VVSLNLLPLTEGCFFGTSDGSEKERDLDFIKQAMALVDDGYRVYYRAWY
jgi:hypothetical protein